MCTVFNILTTNRPHKGGFLSIISGTHDEIVIYQQRLRLYARRHPFVDPMGHGDQHQGGRHPPGTNGVPKGGHSPQGPTVYLREVDLCLIICIFRLDSILFDHWTLFPELPSEYWEFLFRQRSNWWVLIFYYVFIH